MEQSAEGTPSLRRSARSASRSSKFSGIAEDMIGVPNENADEEWEKTERRPRRKNIKYSKECSSLKNPERTICRWSAEEDELLIQLVNKHGMKNWQTIACAIPDRNAHACFSRWKYILDPTINKEAWSQEEELRLIRAHQIYGNSWCKMVKHFPGRTNNALKEHWRGSMKRKVNSYLASGLLEQVPDLHESTAVQQSSQSDIPKDSKVLCDKNQLSSVLSSPKLKQEITELGENADTPVRESSDFIYAKAFDAHSAEVSERIIARPQQCARSRKKRDFLSTSKELESDLQHESTQRRQHMGSENIEGPPRKKSAHCFKDSTLENPESTKGRWLAEEDEMLTHMVSKHGLNNWQSIASAIPGRNSRQCRLRWHRSLDPTINKDDWSEQEELKLIRAHQIYGTQWLKMVKHFPGRTNHALKEHWRGPMKGKLISYLASGLLEQIPDFQDLPVPRSSQSDILNSQGPSVPSVLSARSKSKREVLKLDKDADTSEEETSDCIYPKQLDDHSAKVSEKIISKSKQRARARRKLHFLSSPVELKMCTAAPSCQRPPPRMEQTSPAADNVSPSDVYQDIPPNVPSGHVDMVSTTACSNGPSDVHSSEIQHPCSLERHEVDTSDLLDMSYCDGLMIDSLHDISFM